MATKKKGPGPAALEPKVVRRLLDLLSTDNDFRRLFKKDAQAALAQAGYTPPKGPPFTPPGPPSVVPPVAGSCMQLKAGGAIAPKAQILRDREKLETALSTPLTFTSSRLFQARAKR